MSDENNYLTANPGDFFCPAGGKWYACESGTKFVGCCLSDPCVHHCVGDQLRPAGFSTRVYNQSPGGTCGGDTPFWTCTAATTFWGCCNEDPCKNNSTCPMGQLEPTIMDRPDQLEYFGELNAAMNGSSASPSASATASASSVPAKSDSGVSGAVIGGAVGGTVAFLLLVGLAIFLLCRRRRHKIKKQRATEVDSQQTEQHKTDLNSSTSPHSAGLSPPPMYSPEQHTFTHTPQELPADRLNRYSELEAQEATCYSELPNHPVVEMESPQVSPKPPQKEGFTTTGPAPALAPVERNEMNAGRGLGVMVEEGEGR